MKNWKKKKQYQVDKICGFFWLDLGCVFITKTKMEEYLDVIDLFDDVFIHFGHSDSRD